MNIIKAITIRRSRKYHNKYKITMPTTENFVIAKIKEYNQKIYPNPTFVNYSAIISEYRHFKVNERTIKRWKQDGLIRTIKKTVLKSNKIVFDPANPNHKGKETIETDYYAMEDFIFAKDFNETKRMAEKSLDYKHLATTKGKKLIIRDYAKAKPEIAEAMTILDGLNSLFRFVLVEHIKTQVTGTDLESLTSSIENILG